MDVCLSVCLSVFPPIMFSENACLYCKNSCFGVSLWKKCVFADRFVFFQELYRESNGGWKPMDAWKLLNNFDLNFSISLVSTIIGIGKPGKPTNPICAA